MNIFLKNGRTYLRVSSKTLNIYLDIVSPNRKVGDTINSSCSLRESKNMWCDACNTGIGSWKNTCVKVISCENLLKYSEIFMNGEDLHENLEDIEIDCNDDKKTI